MVRDKPMLNKITAAARKNKTYRALLTNLCSAEKKLDEVEPTMTDSQRDAMWNFYERTEEVNQRLLEIAVELCSENSPEPGDSVSEA